MMRIVLFLSITLSLAAAGCPNGILIVGGKTASGPTKDIRLLSGDWQWCSSSGFPELPYPVVNPGAYFLGGILYVCGFPGDYSCKYAERGWERWSNLGEFQNITDFKMAYSSKVGVMMINKGPDDEDKLGENYHKHNLFHNPGPVQGPSSTLGWMNIVGSPFNLNRDLQNASFSDFQGDLFVSGGFQVFARGTSSLIEGSVGSVAKWSSDGNSKNDGSPAFEDEVVPDMMERREGHSSTEFDEKLVVSGGYTYSYITGHESYQQHKSAEYFDGVEWKTMPSMKEKRAHFGLESMCGVLVALGGIATEDPYSDGKFLSTVEVTRSVESEWNEQLGLELPEGRGYFAAVPLYGYRGDDLVC